MAEATALMRRCTLMPSVQMALALCAEHLDVEGSCWFNRVGFEFLNVPEALS